MQASAHKKSLSTNFADLQDGNTSRDSQPQRRSRKLPHPEALTIEHKTFIKIHTDVLSIEIHDDAMLPYYSPGEIISGRRINLQQLDSLIGKTCIIQTENHGLLLRRLRAGTEPNTYDLLASNTNTSIAMPVLYNVAISGAAPIMWIRRQDV